MLRTYAVASALVLALASATAKAESLELLCEADAGGSATFVVDFDRKTVHQQRGVCTWDLGGGRKVAIPDCNPAGPAEITERSIQWTTTGKRVDGGGGVHDTRIEGSINRQAGSIRYTEDNQGWSGKCRRATQKF